jgi:hypothetical protein
VNVETEYEEDADGNEIEQEVWAEPSYELKISMYLDYSVPAAHYARTLTQGVTLADTRKLAEGFYRGIVQNVKNTMSLKGSPARLVRLIEAVAALYETKAGTGFKRGLADTAGNSSVMGGAALFFRTLCGLAGNGDSTGSFITRMRAIRDTGTVGDEAGSAADYLRGLFEEAGSTAEAARRGGYCRIQQDTAGNETVSLRHLFIFLRLLAGTYIRNYITGRFLRSKEELVIKSPVCREVTLDSTLH